jgi:hypothetical protein
MPPGCAFGIDDSASSKEIPWGQCAWEYTPEIPTLVIARAPQSRILGQGHVRGTVWRSRKNVLRCAAGFAPRFALGRLPRIRVVSVMAIFRQ